MLKGTDSALSGTDLYTGAISSQLLMVMKDQRHERSGLPPHTTSSSFSLMFRGSFLLL